MLVRFPNLQSFDNGLVGSGLALSGSPGTPSIFSPLATLDHLHDLRLRLECHNPDIIPLLRLLSNLTHLAIDFMRCVHRHHDCVPPSGSDVGPLVLHNLRFFAVSTGNSAVTWLDRWQLPQLTHFVFYDWGCTPKSAWDVLCQFGQKVRVLEVHGPHTPQAYDLDLTSSFPVLETLVWQTTQRED
jgi:hypothetical protein